MDAEDKMKKKDDGDASSASSGEDENKERGNWSSQLDFFLSCVGYAVGLGNVWRFPYLCMRNGGGAFLIPYFTFLFLCGIPLFFMELSLGQFSSLSPVSIWRICPIFKGIGWAPLILCVVVCFYYNIIITWVLYYLFASFTSELPWGSCGNSWNTPQCVTRGVISGNDTSATLGSGNSSVSQMMTYNARSVNWTELLVHGSTNSTNTSQIKLRSSAEEYFHFQMLEMSEGIEHLGGIKWQLLLCLMLSWLLIFLCLCRGVKSLGKVVYVTATFPFLLLLILLIRGLLLPGAIKGIRFYIIPTWSRLLSVTVWQEAAVQIFYSLGPAWGGLITMSSYNRFNHNLYREALIVPIINCGTSFFAGFVIFSVLGYMAHLANLSVEEIVTQGPGLAFIVYPEALTRLPISPLWAILFFLMLLTVGLDTQFGMFETIISGFADEYPFIKRRKTLFAALLCVIEMLLGLPLITKGGMYIFQVLDWYSAGFALMTIALFECVVVAWVYGAQRLYDEIELMVGFRPFFVWLICWKFITPVLLTAMLVISIVKMTPPYYGDYKYPGWVQVFGWMVACVSLVPLPIMMVHELLVVQKGPFIKRLRNSFRPDSSWGPALEKFREDYHAKHYAGNQAYQYGTPKSPVEMEMLTGAKTGEKPPVEMEMLTGAKTDEKLEKAHP